MAEAIKEPVKVRAGDTISWTKSLADYPATEGYALAYAFRGNSSTIDVTSTASGADHEVNIAPSTSTAFDPGTYEVQGYVTKMVAQADGSLVVGERHTVYVGRIEVLPDLAAQGSSYDGRSHVKKVLDAIEAVLENRATKEIEESTIEGVQIKRIPHEQLIAMRSKYLSWHNQELAAERLGRGEATGRTILTRFQ